MMSRVVFWIFCNAVYGFCLSASDDIKCVHVKNELSPCNRRLLGLAQPAVRYMRPRSDMMEMFIMVFGFYRQSVCP
jgi:hypothetical protein